jgi:hypothetical protein
VVGSGYYAQNWANYGHETSFFFSFFLFFSTRENWVWYLLVEETMAMWHVIFTKRETHVGVEREIARAHDEKMWKDEKTQENKIGTR